MTTICCALSLTWSLWKTEWLVTKAKQKKKKETVLTWDDNKKQFNISAQNVFIRNAKKKIRKKLKKKRFLVLFVSLLLLFFFFFFYYCLKKCFSVLYENILCRNVELLCACVLWSMWVLFLSCSVNVPQAGSWWIQRHHKTIICCVLTLALCAHLRVGSLVSHMTKNTSTACWRSHWCLKAQVHLLHTWHLQH